MTLTDISMFENHIIYNFSSDPSYSLQLINIFENKQSNLFVYRNVQKKVQLNLR